MDTQMVMRDKYLLAVIEDLSNGELDTERIAKRNHLPYPGVLRAVDQLRADGVVEDVAEGLALTERGKEIFNEIRGLDRIPAGVGADPKGLSRPPERFSPEDNRQRKENHGT